MNDKHVRIAFQKNIIAAGLITMKYDDFIENNDNEQIYGCN